jgi:hypothetical protein
MIVVVVERVNVVVDVVTTDVALSIRPGFNFTKLFNAVIYKFS